METNTEKKCEECFKDEQRLFAFQEVKSVSVANREPILSIAKDLCLNCFKQACKAYKEATVSWINPLSH